MKIIFFGTPQFAAVILQQLIAEEFEIVAVVTKPDKPQGRSKELIPPPVKLLAQSKNIPVYQPQKASVPDFAPILASYEPDLFVVAAYGEIIKQHLLDMPKQGCINVHGSLLPKYRGAAPIQFCLFQGEKETGVTIMHMVLKMDAGEIIKKAYLPLNDSITAGELEEKLSALGASTLVSVLKEMEKGPVPSIPQDESLVTYAPKVELENCEIHWNQPAQLIHNLIRGSNPHPGAWCFAEIHGDIKRLKIFRSEVIPSLSGKPGTFLNYGKQGITVACGEHALRLIEVKLEGKKLMTAEELARGIQESEFILNKK
jgi:methionyl-tRNA formyltransferase